MLKRNKKFLNFLFLRFRLYPKRTIRFAFIKNKKFLNKNLKKINLLKLSLILKTKIVKKFYVRRKKLLKLLRNNFILHKIRLFFNCKRYFRLYYKPKYFKKLLKITKRRTSLFFLNFLRYLFLKHKMFYLRLFFFPKLGFKFNKTFIFRKNLLNNLNFTNIRYLQNISGLKSKLSHKGFKKNFSRFPFFFKKFLKFDVLLNKRKEIEFFVNENVFLFKHKIVGFLQKSISLIFVGLVQSIQFHTSFKQYSIDIYNGFKVDFFMLFYSNLNLNKMQLKFLEKFHIYVLNRLKRVMLFFKMYSIRFKKVFFSLKKIIKKRPKNDFIVFNNKNYKIFSNTLLARYSEELYPLFLHSYRNTLTTFSWKEINDLSVLSNFKVYKLLKKKRINNYCLILKSIFLKLAFFRNNIFLIFLFINFFLKKRFNLLLFLFNLKVRLLFKDLLVFLCLNLIN